MSKEQGVLSLPQSLQYDYCNCNMSTTCTSQLNFVGNIPLAFTFLLKTVLMRYGTNRPTILCPSWNNVYLAVLYPRGESSPRWVNSSIRQAISRRNNYWKRSRQNPSYRGSRGLIPRPTPGHVASFPGSHQVT